MAIQQAVMLVGSGSNGKSVFIELIKRFLGKPNVSSIGLQQLEEDKFAGAQLYGKLANLHADVSARTIENTGIFKMLVAGDSLTVQKKHQHPFEFSNYAKLIFSANKVPATDDETDAYYRRWIILPFPRYIDPRKADKLLIDKLTTDEELSGLLNLVIQFSRWIRNNDIPQDRKSIEENRIAYLRFSNPIKAFVMEATKIDKNVDEPKMSVYNAYQKYCSAYKLNVERYEVFCTALKDMGVEECRPERKDAEGKTRRIQSFRLELKDWRVVEDDAQTGLESFA